MQFALEIGVLLHVVERIGNDVLVDVHQSGTATDTLCRNPMEFLFQVLKQPDLLLVDGGKILMSTLGREDMLYLRENNRDSMSSRPRADISMSSRPRASLRYSMSSRPRADIRGKILMSSRPGRNPDVRPRTGRHAVP